MRKQFNRKQFTNKKCAVLVIALSLSGCAGIPTSSAIHFNDITSIDSANQYVRVIARPPADNSSAEDIVRGFLEACADSGDNYAIARQYLDVTTAQKWNPASGIEFLDTREMKISTQDSRILVSAPHESSINASGFFALAQPGAKLSAQFALARHGDGQWRINALADGLLLSTSELEREFRGYPVYFISNRSADLVPDSVLVPTSSQGIATTLVRSLLAGASSNISKAVRSSVPPGTKLTFGSVPVSAGVATVDLSSEVLSATRTERRELAAQLVWTLTSLPNVSAVRITVSGQSLAISGVGTVQTRTDWLEYKPAAIDHAVELNVVRDRNVRAINADGQEFGVSILADSVPSALGLAAVDLRSNLLAAITADGHTLVWNRKRTALLQPILTGDALTRPSWDAMGDLLIADYGHGVHFVDSVGRQYAVTLEANTVGDVAQIRQVTVAPDGVRVAGVLVEGARDVLFLGSIFSDKLTHEIFGLRELQRTVTSVRDILWLSESDVLILGADASGAEQLYRVDTNLGTLSSDPVPTGSQSIAVDGSGQVVVAVVNGSRQEIYRRVFSRWVLVGPGQSAFYARTHN